MSPLEAPSGPTSLSVPAGAGPPAGSGSDEQPFVRRTRDFGFLPIPRHCQYDPERPFEFTLLLNGVMAAAATFMVSRLRIGGRVYASDGD